MLKRLLPGLWRLLGGWALIDLPAAHLLLGAGVREDVVELTVITLRSP